MFSKHLFPNVKIYIAFRRWCIQSFTISIHALKIYTHTHVQLNTWCVQHILCKTTSFTIYLRPSVRTVQVHVSLGISRYPEAIKSNRVICNRVNVALHLHRLVKRIPSAKQKVLRPTSALAGSRTAVRGPDKADVGPWTFCSLGSQRTVCVIRFCGMPEL